MLRADECFRGRGKTFVCLYLHTQCTHTPVVVPMQHAHSINAAFSTHAAFILLLRSVYTGTQVVKYRYGTQENTV